MEKKQSYLHKDITKEVITTFAVFGLVVSSFVATLGVAAIGVQAQVALAQYGDPAMATAAVMLGDNRQAGDVRPPMPPQATLASSTMVMYCPQIARVIARGSKDATTTGDVRELQRFISNRYHLEASTTITGYFGSTTEKYLREFQQEQGIPPASIMGPLTRAAIAKLCGGPSADGRMGSSTQKLGDMPHPDSHPPMGTSTMGTTTRPALPHIEHRENIVRPKATASPNGAAAIEGLREIGGGVSKIIGAYFSLFGV